MDLSVAEIGIDIYSETLWSIRSESSAVELHCFSDASESGYRVVCCLWFKGNISVVVSVVIGKSRVTPLKVITILQLELPAAAVAVKLAKMIKSWRFVLIEL